MSLTILAANVSYWVWVVLVFLVIDDRLLIVTVYMYVDTLY